MLLVFRIQMTVISTEKPKFGTYRAGKDGVGDRNALHVDGQHQSGKVMDEGPSEYILSLAFSGVRYS